MARRRKKNALDYLVLPKMPKIDLDPDIKKGIYIIIILALGAISFLSMFNMAGTLGDYIIKFLTHAFGWGRFFIPIILLSIGLLLYNEDKYELRKANYFGIFIFLFSILTIFHLFLDEGEWSKAIDAGQGGGYVGYILTLKLNAFMGFWATLIVSVCLLVISLMLMFNTTLIGLFGEDSWFAKLFIPFRWLMGKIFNRDTDADDAEDNAEDAEDNADNADEDAEDDADNAEDNAEDAEDNADDADDEDDEESSFAKASEDKDADDADEELKFVTKLVKNEIKEDVWWQPTGIKIDLPLNLLQDKRGKPTSGDIVENKEIIRKTLENFGIPVEMGDISVGPTVTQYTFKPSEGIKLSRITNLSNDLALALASHPIRIEAPIPGKSLVGVEVPNQAKAIVGLKEILLEKDFKERKSNLLMALGKDVSGRGRLDDITKMPHLLVAGATNSGKSVCLNAVIVSLLYQNNPDDLRFIMVDPKRVELPVYNGIPYLLAPVITDVGKTINALKWCLNEMDRRFDILSRGGKRNIQAYNATAKLRMPYIVFIIDELADLMVAAAKDIEAGVIRLAQMARAVGIHLILATQRPSVDVITGVIKANMPARIAFSVASGIDSRTILDTLGAEKLLGRGDMLFQNAEMSKPVRLQGAFVSDEEIKKIVRFIKDKGNDNYLENITDRQKVKGIGGVGLDGTTGNEDDLLLEAKELIINMGKASASLLQRRLSIGYARAARILDLLEEAGIIGPANGAKPREIMITKDQYERMDSVGVSGVPLHKREEAKAPEEFLEDADDAEDDADEDADKAEDDADDAESSYAKASEDKDADEDADDADENADDADTGIDHADEDDDEEVKSKKSEVRSEEFSPTKNTDDKKSSDSKPEKKFYDKDDLNKFFSR